MISAILGQDNSEHQRLFLYHTVMAEVTDQLLYFILIFNFGIT